MAAKGQEALLAWCQQSVTGCVGVDVKDFHPKTWANGMLRQIVVTAMICVLFCMNTPNACAIALCGY